MKRALVVVGLSAFLALSACGGSVAVEGDGSDAGGASSSGASTSSGGSSGSTGGGSGSGAGSSSGSASSSGSGGSSSGTASSSSGVGGSSGSSSGGPGRGPCPASQPSAGSPCNPKGLTCEYGGPDDVQGCDTLATCQQGGTWAIQPPTVTNCGTVSPACPATYASVPQGSSCSSYGAVCDYDQGRCECTSGGGPVCITPDGSTCMFWFCQSPKTPGCPERRPALGSACSMPNLTCDYGACSVQGGSAEACTNGVWVETFIPCPL